MTKQILSIFKTNTLALAIIPTLAIMLSVGFSYAYAGWSEPSQAPTGGNADAPINVGASSQTKSGALTVGGVLTVSTGTSFTWAGTGNYIYGGDSDIATRQAGSLYVQNQTGSATANVIANDYYISSVGKWASELVSVSAATSSVSLMCTQASRHQNDAVVIMSGDSTAVLRVGTGSSSTGTAWGIRCVNGYQKTGCSLDTNDHINHEYDIAPSANSCMTDNEEYADGGTISATCCKVN